ncbi:MAG: hypothetical protein HYX52_08540 [Chloroflexi bacterium]|nr:hypothetical protein [Chloroflexota bacterium]
MHTRIARTLTAATVLASLAGAAGALAQSTQPPPGVDPATHAAHAAQNPAAHTPTTAAPADGDKQLVDQIAQLRAQVAELQAALAQGHSAKAAQPNGGPAAGMGMRRGKANQPTGQMGGMSTGSKSGTGQMPQPAPGAAQPGGMAGMGGGGTMGNDQSMMAMMQQMMGKMDQMMSGMGMGGAGGTAGAGGGMSGAAGMSGGMMDDMDMMGMGGGMSGGAGMAGGGMPKMDQMMGMGMSRMGGGMNTGSMASTLPGFPGASHIYHLGATGFFLDHATHITLTTEQVKQLNEVKEQSLLNQATLERKVEQAEQDLWNLTASDAPDVAKIDAKAKEIAQLQAEQRIAFIRDVGKAAAVLSDEQRRQLTGMAAPNPAPQAAPASGAMPAMGGGGMSDM